GGSKAARGVPFGASRSRLACHGGYAGPADPRVLRCRLRTGPGRRHQQGSGPPPTGRGDPGPLSLRRPTKPRARASPAPHPTHARASVASPPTPTHAEAHARQPAPVQEPRARARHFLPSMILRAIPLVAMFHGHGHKFVAMGRAGRRTSPGLTVPSSEHGG